MPPEISKFFHMSDTSKSVVILLNLDTDISAVQFTFLKSPRQVGRRQKWRHGEGEKERREERWRERRVENMNQMPGLNNFCSNFTQSNFNFEVISLCVYGFCGKHFNNR